MLSHAFSNRLRSTMLLLGLAALSLPAAAEAKPKGPGEPSAFSAQMNVRGSNGYGLSIGASDHRTILISVFKGSTLASYKVTGRASSEGIEANFGKLGRISVRFTPEKKPTRRKRGCRVVRGHFDGVIRFRGELGYTRVAAKRARGSIEPGNRRGCKSRVAARPGVGSHLGVRDLLAKAAEPEANVTAFGAIARTGGRTVVFYDTEIYEVTPAGKFIPFLTISLASVEERRGRISISRLALLILGRRVAIPSPPGQLPLSATVKAPKPFQGTGSYLAAPGAEPIWTGDFSVPLPGAGLVPLTGPEFESLLCTGPLSKKTDSCRKDLQDLLGEPLLAS